MKDSKKPWTLKEASTEIGKLIANERKRHLAALARGRAELKKAGFTGIGSGRRK